MTPLKFMLKVKEKLVPITVPWPQAPELSQGTGDATKTLGSVQPGTAQGMRRPSGMTIMNHEDENTGESTLFWVSPFIP